MDDVTFMIKTFERPKALERLLASIATFYPRNKVLVADDSRTPYPEISERYGMVEHLVLPFDQGVSRGRNIMLGLVATPLVVNLDDDLVLTTETRLEIMRDLIYNKDVDLVGGADMVDGIIVNCGRRLEVRHGIVVKTPIGAGPADFVSNFFMANTSHLRQVLWDEKLKTYEHTEFFLRAKEVLSIWNCPDVVVLHMNESPGDYSVFRYGRLKIFLQHIQEKHGTVGKLDWGNRWFQNDWTLEIACIYKSLRARKSKPLIN